MNVDYCPHCGFKNVYAGKAPNFCGGCGQPLNVSAASGPTIRRPRQSQQEATPVVNHEVDRVPLISKLEYEIEGTASQKMKLGDVMREQPSENRIKRSTQKSNKVINDQKDVLRESMEICKSARTKPPEDIE